MIGVVNEWMRVALGVLGPRRRRWMTSGPRLHVEVRVAEPAHVDALLRRLARLPEVEPAIRRIDLNPFLRRAIVDIDTGAAPAERVVSLIEQAEAECGLADVPFQLEPEHPADLEPLVRLVAELGGDVAGFWLAVAGRLTAVRVLPLEIDVLAIASVFEGMPTLRQWAEAWLGPQTTSLYLGIATAFAQGLVQSPLGPLVDVAHRSLQGVERLARRRAWLEREPELSGSAMPRSALSNGRRPAPLPPGPVEHWASMAFAGSLGAFGVGMVATGSFAESSAALVGGVPKPARLGREAFAALLGSTLAARGVVVIDPAALRRLDRVNCLAVPSTLLDDPDADGLLEAAREVDLAVEVLAADADQAEQVRRLQRRACVVLFVGDAPTPALAAADVSVGITRPRGIPPWGAHLLAGPHLEEARRVALACGVARRVAADSVTLAEIGVGFGVLSAFGQRLRWATANRVMFATHVATMLAIANGALRAASLAAIPKLVTRDETPWHAIEADDALARLDTDLAGLSSAEAARRRETPEQAPSLSQRLWDAVGEELANPLTPILAVGAGLSAAIGAVTDAALIGTVMLADASIGAIERLRAEDAIADLRTDRPRTVQVVRDDVVVSVPATDLVRGDIVRLEAGNLVPADCRILEAVGLEADESALTGESLPVVKRPAPLDADEVAERSSILYEGTAIAAGSATAVVFALGGATESHQVGAGAAARATPTGVEARLTSLVDLSGPVAIGSGLIAAAANLVRGRPISEVVSTAVSLAVAAVPEGLPMLATAAQLAAARRLATRGVLVRNARAIEALGRAQVVCLDKTGTLTEGRIALACVSDGTGDQPPGRLDAAGRDILRVALRATPEPAPGERPAHGTDRALLDGTEEAGLDGRAGSDGWRPVAELPFASERGYHAVLGRTKRGFRLAVKGAPEVVLPRCSARAQGKRAARLDASGRERLEGEARRLARRGLRVLAMADRSMATNGGLGDDRVSDLVFRGFVGLADPVRPSAVRAVAGLRQAGVRLVMMTGDHPTTAESIAAELGLDIDGHTLTGAAIDQLDDAALARVVPDVAVFARVAPRHKARLVDALERAGQVVAMTGDGANDAAAIRRASVGIAVGRRCTTAARNAADLVLTDDRIETLVDAVLEGRAMWTSVRDAVAVLVGGNLGEIGLILTTALAAGGSALNTRQLLLVNILTDTAPALAIALRPPPAVTPEALLREGPDVSLGTPLVRDIAWRGLLTTASAGGAWLAARTVARRPRASTVALVALVGAQLGQTLVVGGRSPIVIGASLASFGALATVVQIPGLSHFFGCRPLGPIGWTIAGTASALATGASVLLPRLLPSIDPWIERLGATDWLAGPSAAASDAEAPLGPALAS